MRARALFYVAVLAIAVAILGFIFRKGERQCKSKA